MLSLIHISILVKSRFGMTLKVRNGTVKPDGIFQVKFIADLFQASEDFMSSGVI